MRVFIRRSFALFLSCLLVASDATIAFSRQEVLVSTLASRIEPHGLLETFPLSQPLPIQNFLGELDKLVSHYREDQYTGRDNRFDKAVKRLSKTYSDAQSNSRWIIERKGSVDSSFELDLQINPEFKFSEFEAEIRDIIEDDFLGETGDLMWLSTEEKIIRNLLINKVYKNELWKLKEQVVIEIMSRQLSPDRNQIQTLIKEMLRGHDIFRSESSSLPQKNISTKSVFGLSFSGGTAGQETLKALTILREDAIKHGRIPADAITISVQGNVDDGGSSFDLVWALAQNGWGIIPPPGDQVNALFSSFASIEKNIGLLDNAGRIRSPLHDAQGDPKNPDFSKEKIVEHIALMLQNQVKEQLRYQPLEGRFFRMEKDYLGFAANILRLAQITDKYLFTGPVKGDLWMLGTPENPTGFKGASIRNLLLLAALIDAGVLVPPKVDQKLKKKQSAVTKPEVQQKYQEALDNLAKMAGIENGGVTVSSFEPATLWARYRDATILLEDVQRTISPKKGVTDIMRYRLNVRSDAEGNVHYSHGIYDANGHETNSAPWQTLKDGMHSPAILFHNEKLDIVFKVVFSNIKGYVHWTVYDTRDTSKRRSSFGGGAKDGKVRHFRLIEDGKNYSEDVQETQVEEIDLFNRGLDYKTGRYDERLQVETRLPVEAVVEIFRRLNLNERIFANSIQKNGWLYNTGRFFWQTFNLEEWYQKVVRWPRDKAGRQRLVNFMAKLRNTLQVRPGPADDLIKGMHINPDVEFAELNRAYLLLNNGTGLVTNTGQSLDRGFKPSKAWVAAQKDTNWFLHGNYGKYGKDMLKITITGSADQANGGGYSKMLVRPRLVLQQTNITETVTSSPPVDVGFVGLAPDGKYFADKTKLQKSTAALIPMIREVTGIITMGPGSLLTSLMPYLLNEDVVRELYLKRNGLSGKKVPIAFIFNFNKDNESIDLEIPQLIAFMDKVLAKHDVWVQEKLGLDHSLKFSDIFSDVVINDESSLESLRFDDAGKDRLNETGDIYQELRTNLGAGSNYGKKRRGVVHTPNLNELKKILPDVGIWLRNDLVTVLHDADRQTGKAKKVLGYGAQSLARVSREILQESHDMHSRLIFAAA